MRGEERRKAYKLANPKEAAITEAILEKGKSTGNYFQAFWDHYGRPKTA